MPIPEDSAAEQQKFPPSASPPMTLKIILDENLSDETRSSLSESLATASPAKSPLGNSAKSISNASAPRNSGQKTSIFARGNNSSSSSGVGGDGAKKAAAMAMPDASKPLYYLMQFNELLELNVNDQIAQLSSVSASQSSHRDSEGSDSVGYSFLGIHIGKFWTSSNQQQHRAHQSQSSEATSAAVSAATARYHSIG
jgi:hypothetical protein